MLKTIIRSVTLIAFFLSMTACGFFDKDNTPAPAPLVKFTPEIRPHLLWSVRTGSGVGKEYLKMSPTLSDTAIYTTSANGTVTSINRFNGRKNWQVSAGIPITTGAGVGDGLVVVASRSGEVAALQETNGGIRWLKKIPGEFLATPTVSRGIVVVKATDGYVRALSASNGHDLWSYQQVEPSLILRGSSSPQLSDSSVIVGFANGNLAKLTLPSGQLQWLQYIAIPEGAFAIQRMIDIDADPVVFDHRIYAATYQGKIASLDWTSGKTLWSHDISSYTGMAADSSTVFISDARSFVWAFNADSGLVNWRQTDLDSRNITGPATMSNFIVVGDGQGYLHWIDKRDGHFVARERAGSAFYAAPVVANNLLYALSTDGKLSAYSLS